MSGKNWLQVLLHCSNETCCILSIQDYRTLQIWNPITNLIITLPDPLCVHEILLDRDQEITALLSSDPFKDPKSCVLLFLSDRIMSYPVGSHYYRDSVWRSIGYPAGVLQQPVVLAGEIYALNPTTLELVNVRVDDSTGACTGFEKKAPNPGPGSITGKSYLVKKEDQELYLVTLSVRYRKVAVPEIQVRKFDPAKQLWVEPGNSLKGGELFLGRRISLFMPATEKKWSYIYFDHPHDSCQYTLKYRMEDERIVWNSRHCSTSLWLPCWTKRILMDHTDHLVDSVDGNADVGNGDHANAKRPRMGSVFEMLSEDLLGLIAEKLGMSAVDHFQFGRVAKIGKEVMMRKRQNPFKPCLIYRNKADSAYYITDSNLNNKLRLRIPQGLQGYNLCCSKYGWLVLEKQHSTYALFNPCTKQIIPTAAREKGDISNITIYLGKNNIVLLGMISSSSSFPAVQPGNPARPGEAQWLTFKHGSIEYPDFKLSNNNPVFTRQCWYYLGNNGNVGCLRLSETEIQWEVEEHEWPCREYPESVYWTGCGGELLAVLVGESSVEVFQKGNGKWQEVDSLGGYCLYLGWPSSMSCIAETSDVADRIYFPRFFEDSLVYYSMRTRKYHYTGNPRKVLTSFDGTTMFSDSAWIQLNWS